MVSEMWGFDTWSMLKLSFSVALFIEANQNN